jgi:S-adenosylhomocysteine hydrolase
MSAPKFIEDMPLLVTLVKRWKRKLGIDLRDTQILLITHLLRDAPAFVDALIHLGAYSSNVHVVGKPYSTMEETVSELKKFEGIHVWSAGDMSEFYSNVQAALLEIRLPGKFVVIEDGGYFLREAFKIPAAPDVPAGPTGAAVPAVPAGNEFLRECVGIVEQTTIGITRDREILETAKPRIRVMNVAKCQAKNVIESTLVGLAIRRNIERLLFKLGWAPTGRTVLVVGYGSIGAEVAKAFKESGSTVLVYDKRPIARIQARQDSFWVDRTLEKLLPEADIIIGCTGEQWARGKELLMTKHNAVFVCASSERIEYAHEELEENSLEARPIKDVGTLYRMVTKNDLLLLAEGYPVNFYGTQKESIPERNFQVVPGLLLAGMIQLVLPRTDSGSWGVVELNSELENEITETYETQVWPQR